MMKGFSLACCFLGLSSGAVLGGSPTSVLSPEVSSSQEEKCPSRSDFSAPQGALGGGEQKGEKKRGPHKESAFEEGEFKGKGPQGPPKGGPRAGHRHKARLLYFNHLIMERYDENKNGKLDEAELQVLKKDAESYKEKRKQELIARFDENKNGILEKEEMQKAQETLRAEMRVRLSRLRAHSDRSPEDRPLGPGLPEEAPREKGSSCSETEKAPCLEGGREGKKGFEKGPRAGGFPGQGGGRLPHFIEWQPKEVVMVFNIVGHELVREKFDLDKDGKLSEEERAQMAAHKHEFFEFLRKDREKRRQQRAQKEAQKEVSPSQSLPKEG